jgi:glyoxylase-like metal-dependent hydrolase (beta-lactamase superfamily II)
MIDPELNALGADWSVAAIRIGRSVDRPIELLVSDATPGPLVELAYYVWLVRLEENRVLLVDAGFGAVAARARSVEPTFDLDAACGLLGVAAITEILITHGHWDHAGGMSLLPDVPILMSSAEVRSLRALDGTDSESAKYYDLAELGTLWATGRLRTFDDSIELSSHVRAVCVGGHTLGHAVVEIEAPQRQICLMGDLAYLERNLASRSAPSIAVDRDRCLQVYDDYGSPHWDPIPGHDPATLEHLGLRIHDHVAVA